MICFFYKAVTRITLSLILVGYTQLVISQTKADSLGKDILNTIRARNYEEAWNKYENFLSFYDNNDLTSDTTYAKTTLYIAQSYIFANKNALSADHYQEAIDLFEQDTILPPIYKMQSYLGIGVAYKRMNRLDLAIANYIKAKDLVITEYGSDDKGLHNIYNNLGNVYRIQGDYERSIENHQYSLRIRKIHYPDLDYHIGDSYNNLGLVYTDIHQYSKAILHFQQASRHYKDEDSRIRSRAAQAQYNIARIYYNLENYDKAMEFIDPAIDLMQKSEADYEFDYAEMLNTKTNLLVKLNKLEEAERLLHLTENKKSKYLDEGHLNWSYTNTTAAILAKTKEDYEDEKSHLIKNLNIYRKQYIGFHINKVTLWSSILVNSINQSNRIDAKTSLDSITYLITDPKAIPFKHLLIPISKNAEAKYAYFLFRLNMGDKYLKKASELAMEGVLNLGGVNSFFEETSRGLLASEQRQMADFAMRVNSQCYTVTEDEKYLYNTLKISDAQKSKILKTLVSNDQMISYNGLDDDVLKRKKHLKNALNEFRISIENNDNNNWDVETFDSINNELISTQDQILEKIGKDKDLIFRKNNLDIPLLLDYARKKEITFLSYYLAKSDIYIHKIDNNGIALKVLNIQDDFSIKEFRDSLLENDSMLNTSNIRCLVQDLIKKEDDQKNIVIIPDGALHTIPFEVLPIDEKGDTLLLALGAISYGNSLEFWLNQVNQKKIHGSSILAFAPDYSNKDIAGNDDFALEPYRFILRDENHRLEGALQSVAEIGNNMKGTVFLGRDATKGKFKNNFDNHNLLHFSMHAFASETDPLSSGLIFQPSEEADDNILTAREVFSLELDSELAVIAACNSGWGKLNKSEGIQSLGYAFTYAGVKSTIISLWKVPDQATSQIMQAFYHHLQMGVPKNHALRMAKLEFIENTIVNRQKHPFFWAGFVLHGDVSGLYLEQNDFLVDWYLGLFSIILLVILYIIRKHL